MTREVEVLRRLIAPVKLVLFDFDGPLCDVFAGYPASDVARELEKLAGETFRTDDPLEVLRRVAGSSVADSVEDALIVAEVRAVSCSSATIDGVESLRKCLASGLRVGIVSNNSEEAVRVFLATQRLENVSPVVGRERRHPELMKPHSWPMRKALAAAECSAESTVFVGDSLSDIEVARAVSMPCVAYANKPGKRALFEGAGAVTIDSMAELTSAVG